VRLATQFSPERVRVEGRAAQHDHGRNLGLGVELQGPFEAGALRGAGVQFGLVAHRQAGVGGRIDAQVLGDETRDAGRDRPLGGGRQGDGR
jgi:hypothetical protein